MLAVAASLLLAAFAAAPQSIVAQDRASEVDGLVAFARAYGYIRFFHPGDEASGVDWDRFAIEGARRLAGTTGTTPMREALEEIFLPIAPTVRFLSEGEAGVFADPWSSAPDSPIVAWQHAGVGVSSAPFYQSLRLERPERHGSGPMPATLDQTLEIGDLAGRDFVLRVRLRTQFHGVGGGAVPVVFVQREGGLQGFTHFPLVSPIRSDEWLEHEVRGRFDDDAVGMTVGFWTQGLGSAWFADPRLLVRDDAAEWISMPGFTKFWADDTERLAGAWSFEAVDHTVETGAPPRPGATPSVHVRFEGPDRLFDERPEPREVFEAEIAPGLRVKVPISLPAAQSDGDAGGSVGRRSGTAAGSPLETGSLDDLAVRSAGVVITWSVLRHFYPYSDVVDVPWERMIREALVDAREARTELDYLLALERMLAPLDDGHAQVVHPVLAERVELPLRLALIEGRLVVEAAADTAVFRPGDVLLRIDGTDVGELLEGELRQVSGSPQFRVRRAVGRVGRGPSGTLAAVELKRGHETRIATVVREPADIIWTGRPEPITEVVPRIYYVDLRRTGMGLISEHLPALAAADGVILDSRGFPAQGTQQLFAHITDRPLGWIAVCIPKTIRPKAAGGEGCLTLNGGGPIPPPREPRFTGTTVVLTDERAYSTAESYLARLEHEGSAILLGRPTGGANGNQNWVKLPGGVRVHWTGMRITRPDGSPHHGRGIRPTHRVTRTVDAIRDGRDEDIEAAVELIRDSQPSGAPPE